MPVDLLSLFEANDVLCTEPGSENWIMESQANVLLSQNSTVRHFKLVNRYVALSSTLPFKSRPGACSVTVLIFPLPSMDTTRRTEPQQWVDNCFPTSLMSLNFVDEHRKLFAVHFKQYWHQMSTPAQKGKDVLSQEWLVFLCQRQGSKGRQTETNHHHGVSKQRQSPRVFTPAAVLCL